MNNIYSEIKGVFQDAEVPDVFQQQAVDNVNIDEFRTQFCLKL